MMDWNKAQTLLDAATRILVVTHVSPDGDAIGSLMGISHALRTYGKTVIAAVDGGTPPSLRFLPGTADVLASLDANISADLMIAVDCGDKERTGKVGQAGFALNIPIINIDHHRTNSMFGDANLVDLNTVAASEGVLDLLGYLHIALNLPTAQCLLCGIVTDTLCFRTNNVTANTFGKAQLLMAAGADLSLIVQRTINHISAAGVKLWKQVIPTMCLEDHVIWATITIAARKESGYTNGADSGLVSWMIQAEGAYISCVLREKEDNQVEVSLRAVPGFDVSNYAVSVGGGGHSLASGAMITGSLAEVQAKVIPALKEIAKASKPLYNTD